MNRRVETYDEDPRAPRRQYEVIFEFENHTRSLPHIVEATNQTAAAFKLIWGLFGRQWKELLEVSEGRYRLARNKRTLSNTFVTVKQITAAAK